MSPLTALVLLLSTGAPAHPCFTPTDQTAGWKRVVLPDEAPALAAPADLEQFRSGEPAVVFEQDPPVYAGTWKEHHGRMSYDFWVPAHTRQLDIGFFEDLQGAKIDAVVYAAGRAYPLLDERRVGGTRLSLQWPITGVDHVVVTVHYHLRSRPGVRTWQLTRWLVPGAEPALPDAFRAPRSLYYRHPGGRRVELCNAPGREAHLSRWPDTSTQVTDVTLQQP